MEQIETLYMQYKQDIYRYLLHLTKNPTLSEDLLQETYTKAIVSIVDFQGKSSVKTWLFSIARHLWLQNLRRSKQEIEYTDFLGIYMQDNLPERLITREIVTRIEDVLRERDQRTQKIVQMRIEGYSYAEISESIGVAESSARVIDFRTKKAIRLLLEKEGLL